MIKSALLFSGLLAIIFFSCAPEPVVDKKLPILGFKDYVDGDTLYHEIPDFKFVDQDSNFVTNATFAGKIYVTDMFFTTCPSICPIVKRNMLTLYDEFENEDRLRFISHSLDPDYDKVPVLKAYAENIHIETERWKLVTGEEDHIYEMAGKYFISAERDATAPGGFNHSGQLVLVDTKRHVRAFCDGTDAESVNGFIKDVRQLLDEMD